MKCFTLWLMGRLHSQVKDYKQIKLSEMNDDFREEESDGGYSDFDAEKEEKDDVQKDADWSPGVEEDVGSATEPEAEELSWPCNLCGQMFRSKGGLSRHQFVRHGMRALKPKLDILSGSESCSFFFV